MQYASYTESPVLFYFKEYFRILLSKVIMKSKKMYKKKYFIVAWPAFDRQLMKDFYGPADSELRREINSNSVCCTVECYFKSGTHRILNQLHHNKTKSL